MGGRERGEGGRDGRGEGGRGRGGGGEEGERGEGYSHESWNYPHESWNSFHGQSFTLLQHKNEVGPFPPFLLCGPPFLRLLHCGGAGPQERPLHRSAGPRTETGSGRTAALPRPFPPIRTPPRLCSAAAQHLVARLVARFVARRGVHAQRTSRSTIPPSPNKGKTSHRRHDRTRWWRTEASTRRAFSRRGRETIRLRSTRQHPGVLLEYEAHRPMLRSPPRRSRCLPALVQLAHARHAPRPPIRRTWTCASCASPTSPKTWQPSPITAQIRSS